MRIRRLLWVYVMTVVFVLLLLLLWAASRASMARAQSISDDSIILVSPKCGETHLVWQQPEQNPGQATLWITYENGKNVRYTSDVDVWAKTGAVGYRFEYPADDENMGKALSIYDAYVEVGETIHQAPGDPLHYTRKCVYISNVLNSYPAPIPPFYRP